MGIGLDPQLNIKSGESAIEVGSSFFVRLLSTPRFHCPLPTLNRSSASRYFPPGGPWGQGLWSFS